VLTGSVPTVVVNDGLSGGLRRSGNDVVRSQPFLLCFADKIVGQTIPKNFSLSRLGRLKSEVLVLEEVVDEPLINSTTSTHCPVSIILLFAFRVVSDYRINKYISRASVEVVALVYASRRVWRDEADVGNAADVLAYSEFGRMVKKESVEKCNERGPLPPCSLVAHSEVHYGCDASARCDECTLGHGKCRLDMTWFGHGKKPDCLTVRSNQVNA
jgi:hypothetical protein